MGAPTTSQLTKGFPPCGPAPACSECGDRLVDRAATLSGWDLRQFGSREGVWVCTPCAEVLKATWRMEHVAELMAEARIPRVHRAAELAHLPMLLQKELARWAATSENLAVFGPIGAGKSYALAAVCRELLVRGRSVQWWATTDVLIAARSFDLWEAETLPRLRGVDVLVLDDIGAERGTDFGLATLAALVGGRWDEGLPTAVSSNLDVAALLRWHPRTASRLLSGSRVQLTGRDRRLSRRAGGA